MRYGVREALKKKSVLPHILFEKLRQGEMLKRLCELHAALIVSRLGALTEPNLPVKHSARALTLKNPLVQKIKADTKDGMAKAYQMDTKINSKEFHRAVHSDHFFFFFTFVG